MESITFSVYFSYFSESGFKPSADTAETQSKTNAVVRSSFAIPLIFMTILRKVVLYHLSRNIWYNLILLLCIIFCVLSIIFVDNFRKNIIKSNFEMYNEVHSGFTVSSTHAGMNPHLTAFLTERIFDHAEQ